MKQAFKKLMMFASGVVMMAVIVISSSDADMMPKNGAKTTIDARAHFITAAFVMFEHETFDMSEFNGGDPNEILEKEAMIHVSGAPGESVMVACNVHNGRTRDCDGSDVSQLRLVRAGEDMRSYVALSQDLLPIKKHNSHITIEVSYI